METKESLFTIKRKEFVFYELLLFLTSVFSLTLLTPLFIYISYKKYAESMVIDGKIVVFKGKLYEIYWRYLLWLILTSLIITIYQIALSRISSFVPSALIGENIDELGVRFPDMSHIYTLELKKIVKSVAEKEHIDLKEGVYIQLTGPNFETPAEIKMYRTLGADAVGMSTACEAMAASHMKMQVVGISVISNLAAGMTDNPLTHEEVQETADRTAPIFKKLIRNSIKEIYKKVK